MLFKPYPIHLPPHHWIYKSTHDLLRKNALDGFRSSHIKPLSSSVLNQISQQSMDWVFFVNEPHVLYKLVMGNVIHPITQQKQLFSVLVNQRGDVFEISVQAHQSFFQGSVFEGYMTLQPLNTTPSQTTNTQGYRQIFRIHWVEMIRGDMFDGADNYMRHYETTHKLFDLIHKDMLKKNVFQWDRVAEEIVLQDPNKIVCLGNAHGLKFQSVSCYRYKYIESIVNKNTFFPCLRIFSVSDQTTIYQWENPITLNLLVEGKFDHHEWNYRLGFYSTTVIQWWDETKPCCSSSKEPHDIWYNLDRLDDFNTSTTIHFLKNRNQKTFRLIGQFKCYVGHIPHTCCLKHIRWLDDGTMPHTKSQVEERLNVMYEKLQLNDLLKIVHF